MIKFCVLGSGSKGNAVYVDVNGYRLLIDAGFTQKELSRRLSKIGKTLEGISAIYVTHDHGDHLASWVGKSKIYRKNKPVREVILHNKNFCGLIDSFNLSHDTNCVGYVIEDNEGNKMAILMDTGCVPEEAIGCLFDCQAILIETNYDIDKLVEGRYPTEMQERITSSTGHLRNECAGEVVKMVAWDGLKYIVGMHISIENNDPMLATWELSQASNGYGIAPEIHIAKQDKVSKMFFIIS